MREPRSAALIIRTELQRYEISIYKRQQSLVPRVWHGSMIRDPQEDRRWEIAQSGVTRLPTLA